MNEIIDMLYHEQKEHKKTKADAIVYLKEAAHRFDHLAQTVVSQDPYAKKVFESNRDDFLRLAKQFENQSRES